MSYRINPFLDFSTKDKEQISCSYPVSGRYNYNNNSKKVRFSARYRHRYLLNRNPFLYLCECVEGKVSK